MSIISFPPAQSEEPTPEQLAAIEVEWPLIAAELDLLDAHIALIHAGPGATALDWRRIRRAERRVLEASRELADRESFIGGAA